MAARELIALAQFRNANGIIDPEKQAAVQLQMISKLQDELIGSRMQLLQLRAMAPENPQIPSSSGAGRWPSREIDQQLGIVAGNRGSCRRLRRSYQRLQLEREFADKRLGCGHDLASGCEGGGAAQTGLCRAHRSTQPAGRAEEPRRLRGIFATLDSRSGRLGHSDDADRRCAGAPRLMDVERQEFGLSLARRGGFSVASFGLWFCAK